MITSKTQVVLLIVVATLFTSSHGEANWPVRGSNQIDDPVANPKAIVYAGNARFTILTPQLIRMEIDHDKKFIDEASFVFINRNLTVPEFTVKTSGDLTVINTGALELIFNKATIDNWTFHAGNLNITFPFDGEQLTWHPGMLNLGNLHGTRMSIDCYYDWFEHCESGEHLDPGLISTDGWYMFDDSKTPLFNDSAANGDIPWVSSADTRGLSQDWYFFGYGWNFKQLLFDYTLVAGPISIPPVSAFGTWWSRCCTDTENELITEIIDGYKNHSLPLNHLVIDMEWHIETANSQCKSWGGYTWNTTRFPDPQNFFEYLRGPENNLKVLLNIHPGAGVDPCQAEYMDYAHAIGFDTKHNDTIPCDFMDQRGALNLFEIVLEPISPDYWWTDYDGCDPYHRGWTLFWNNYLFDMQQSTKGKRPLVLSRFGGPGNHRYPIGFSGDAYSVFPSLAFEVYMTSTAANILFGYWSHDTGGFHGKQPDNELYLRWLQFASVEPIYRIHSDNEERRIWVFPSYEAMKQTMIFRNSIGPYIYTQARRAFDTGVTIVTPLYYDFPLMQQAYSYKHQYMFGTDMFAAPVIAQGDNKTQTTSKQIWLPPGTWVDFNSHKILTGPQEFTWDVPFSQLPLYIRAGAIIPMKDMNSVTNYTPDPLIFTIFPGADSNNCSYYEDDGNSTGYLSGEYAFTFVSYSVENTTGLLMKVMINPPAGTFKTQPSSRTFQVQLVNSLSPKSATFECGTSSTTMNQISVQSTGLGWWLVGDTVTLQTPPATNTTEIISFVVQL